jgi:hypothetical protein
MPDPTRWNGLKRTGFKRKRTIATQKKFIARKTRKNVEWRKNRKGGLARQSKKQKERMAKYWPVRAKFLEENPYCSFCMCLKGIKTPSTEVHHIYGRRGDLLWNPEHFVPSCYYHRLWPHNNQVKAAEYGWMPKSLLRNQG